MPPRKSTRRAQYRELVRVRLGEANGVDQLVAACLGVEEDPRLQVGSYITDGAELYEVLGISCGAARIGYAKVRLILEDCRGLGTVDFLLDKVRRQFTLVGPARDAA